MLLVHLISEYENKEWDLPAVNLIETIKIRMEEFGLKPSDLAKEYGNKGNLSKVLNYQRALSLYYDQTVLAPYSISQQICLFKNTR